MVRAASGGGEKTQDFLDFAGVDTMSDGARERGEPGEKPTDEAALSARLKSLGERLDQGGPGSHSETGPAARSAADASALARGFRLSTELVAGVVVGGILGWLLDRWLGISPWGLFVFVLLGFAAGVLNVMRSAGLMSGGVPDSTNEHRNDR